MIDAAGRADRIVAAGDAPEVGVVLLDVVLGRARTRSGGPGCGGRGGGPSARRCARPPPRRGRLGRRRAARPAGALRQVARLEAAGVMVLPSNAEAARFAALLLRPELAATLLGPAA